MSNASGIRATVKQHSEERKSSSNWTASGEKASADGFPGLVLPTLESDWQGNRSRKQHALLVIGENKFLDNAMDVGERSLPQLGTEAAWKGEGSITETSEHEKLNRTVCFELGQMTEDNT